MATTTIILLFAALCTARIPTPPESPEGEEKTALGTSERRTAGPFASPTDEARMETLTKKPAEHSEERLAWDDAV
jgi:hypothetical protein